MRIIFMGTPAFALPALDALHAAGHDIVAAYTRAPQPAGRGKALQKSPVHARAEALGIPVLSPRSLRSSEEQAIFAAFEADVAVVAAYGLLLPQPVLDAPARGCINIHGSLLPRWRGAAPIQRAILAGDAETGITIMQMEAGLDTGPMLLAEPTPIGCKTAGDLFVELAAMGARLLLRVLDEQPAAVLQPDGATHAAKVLKAEAHLDFQQPAEMLERAIRAFNPAPGAYADLSGERLKILGAEVLAGTASPGVTTDDALTIGTGESLLRPTRVQRAGKPAMTTAELLRGWPIPAGTRLA
jgi:methionyl-tRNA formyltransferase